MQLELTSSFLLALRSVDQLVHYHELLLFGSRCEDCVFLALRGCLGRGLGGGWNNSAQIGLELQVLLLGYSVLLSHQVLQFY